MYFWVTHLISPFVRSFPGGGVGEWDVEPSRTKRLCYQSCKMVYYLVSNCTWKETSNLYEKCLRLPAHPVIHARSVPVMLKNKGGAYHRKETPHAPQELEKGSSKMLFSKMNWSWPLQILRSVGLSRRKRIFLLIYQGSLKHWCQGELFGRDCLALGFSKG